MSEKTTIIDGETGEVTGEVLYPEGNASGETLNALVPYNRSKIIARTTLTRMDWDKKAGTWVTDMGETDELTAVLVKATEVYSCWSDQIGKPTCQGFGVSCRLHPETSEMGYRLALDTEEFGNVWVDLYGLAQRIGSAACKHAEAHNGQVNFKGSKVINTQNGPFHIPRIVK